MKTNKLALSVVALVFGSQLMAQMPEIKGAEQLLRQAPPSILEAKKSIDKASSIAGAEALPYFWYVKGYTYGLLAEKKDSTYKVLEPNASEIAISSIYKFYTIADEKSLRKYKDAANDVLPSIVSNGYNKSINLRDDSSFSKSLALIDDLALLIKYDADHDEILKTKIPALSYNNVLLQGYSISDITNDNVKARSYLQQLIENKYVEPKLYIYMARTFEKENNSAKQLETIKNGRAAYPENKDIINEEVNYYIQNDKLGQLKTIINNEIEGGNADANFYFIRGYINDQTGMGNIDANGRKSAGKMDTSYLNRAIEDYKKTLELNPNSLDATYNLAVIYTNLGNYYYEATSKLPYNETAKFDVLKKLETTQFSTAISYFESADGFAQLSNAERGEMYLYLKQLYGKTKQMKKVKEMNDKIKALK